MRRHIQDVISGHTHSLSISVRATRWQLFHNPRYRGTPKYAPARLDVFLYTELMAMQYKTGLTWDMAAVMVKRRGHVFLEEHDELQREYFWALLGHE